MNQQSRKVNMALSLSTACDFPQIFFPLTLGVPKSFACPTKLNSILKQTPSDFEHRVILQSYFSLRLLILLFGTLALLNKCGKPRGPQFVLVGFCWNCSPHILVQPSSNWSWVCLPDSEQKKIANSLRSVIVGGFLAARMQVLQRAPTSLRHWEPEKKSWH